MSEINASQPDQAELHKNLELGLPKATAARTAYKWLKMLKEEPEHKKLAAETKFRLQPYLRLLDPERAHKRLVEAEMKAEMEKNRMEIDQVSAASPDTHKGKPLVLLTKK